MIPADQIAEKAAMLADYEDRLNIFDTMILCRFYRDLYPWEALEQLISMVIGMPISIVDLHQTAAAIADMTRQFNLREGLQPAHDWLPRRLHREALHSGHRLTADEMSTLIGDYYAQRGWDENGVPAVPSRN